MNIELLLSEYMTKELALIIINNIEGEIKSRALPSLYIKHSSKRLEFAEYISGSEHYLKKSDPRLYTLARRKYCILLLRLLRTIPCLAGKRTPDFDKAYMKFCLLISDLESTGLDIARIKYSKRHYDWVFADYPKKSILPGTRTYFTDNNIEVRSKSEQKIGNLLESFGIPYRYEQRYSFNVDDLVDSLEKELADSGWNSPVLSMSGKVCNWNVPDNFKWMNSPGSLWKTYNPNNGTVTIHPDFSILLADGSILLWEHEGLSDKFSYRMNAAERIFVMQTLNVISEHNLIYTFEHHMKKPDTLIQIVTSRILLRV